MTAKSTTTPIPSFDLDRARSRIEGELRRRLDDVLERNAFVGGPEVAELERAFAEYLGAGGCVGVANGTDALVVALRALGLEPGDEVVVPAFTFIATGSAVALAGGIPVFADVDPTTFNLDADRLEARITPRTVGVIGVHLFGVPFDVEGIRTVCRRHGLWLVEDAAQAHGALYGDRRVGTFGELATWSFYPSKNLGAFGDAGAVTGMDADLLDRVRRIANHGRAEHYRHTELGTNSRLDGFQAAVLNCRLQLLEEDNGRRRRIAERYGDGLGDLPGLTLPRAPSGTTPVWHQYTVRCSRRDDLRDHLAEQGIGTGIFYPIPLHRQPALEKLPGAADPRPVSEAACREVVSLPMFPELTDPEVDRVIDHVRAFFEDR